jgi:hypothetical protein
MYTLNHMGRQNPNSNNNNNNNNNNSVGVLIEAFGSNQPGPSAPQYGPGNFNPQLGPGTDGFEGELQFYIDGPTSTWIAGSPWLDTIP